MQIFINNLTKITDTKYSIGFQHNMPFDSENGMKKNNGTLYTETELIATYTLPAESTAIP